MVLSPLLGSLHHVGALAAIGSLGQNGALENLGSLLTDGALVQFGSFGHIVANPPFWLALSAWSSQTLWLNSIWLCALPPAIP